MTLYLFWIGKTYRKLKTTNPKINFTGSIELEFLGPFYYIFFPKPLVCIFAEIVLIMEMVDRREALRKS